MFFVFSMSSTFIPEDKEILIDKTEIQDADCPTDRLR